MFGCCVEESNIIITHDPTNNNKYNSNMSEEVPQKAPEIPSRPPRRSSAALSIDNSSPVHADDHKYDGNNNILSSVFRSSSLSHPSPSPPSIAPEHSNQLSISQQAEDLYWAKQDSKW
jgi:hypothetical protein